MATTRERILEAATALMREAGPAAVTFDAVAAAIGLSKQAVIYWFPNKAELLAGVRLPCLREEAAAAITAATAAPHAAQAARDVVLALVGFHLQDMQRFRLMYAAPQLEPQHGFDAAFFDRVHEVTGEMYGAIADALGGGSDARAEAVALHMAALGHVLLAALTDALDDPLRHPHGVLADTLAGLLARGVEGRR